MISWFCHTCFRGFIYTTATDVKVHNQLLFADGMPGELVCLFVGMFGCCTLSVLYPALLTYRADYQLSYKREKENGSKPTHQSDEFTGHVLSSSGGGEHRLRSVASIQMSVNPMLSPNSAQQQRKLSAGADGAAAAGAGGPNSKPASPSVPGRRLLSPQSSQLSLFVPSPNAAAAAQYRLASPLSASQRSGEAGVGVAVNKSITLDQVLKCDAALQLFRRFCVEHFGTSVGWLVGLVCLFCSKRV